jgi:hypothetical protein
VPCGKANHSQCDQTSAFSQTVKRPGVPSARWSRSVGVVPAPMNRSTRTGYATRTRRSSAAGSSLGISYVAT